MKHLYASRSGLAVQFVLLCVISVFVLCSGRLHAQTFPNPATLSTGQGALGATDPIWQVSEFWYAASPPNPMGLNYTSALINYNCAPGAWVDASTLPPPVNNGNWITGPDANCATNTNAGYRYFRLTLNLPPDCNGFSVTVPGSYVLSFDGYVDNQIAEVFINGNPQGISGGSFSAGSQLSFTLNGPWLVGTNYVDVMVLNQPNGGGTNPYGLLLVANAASPTDTDNDGVPNIDDLCPCTPGNNSVGCTDPPNYNNCDLDAIRQAFTAAGCQEMYSCVGNCSMYFLNPQSMSGSQAQAFAQTLGANLVSIQSAAENQCIVSSLSDMNQSGVIWIGFNDEAVEGSFVWYDQSPVVYTNWAAGEPNDLNNEDCTQIYADGTWNDLNCGTASAQSIIEVNLCPVVNAGLDVSVCIGDTAQLAVVSTLFGSSPYTYTWSNGPTGINNPVSPATNTDYSVTSVDRYDCTAGDTVTVTVNPLPAVDAGPDVTVCPQTMVTLSGSGAATYTWSGGITNGVPFLPGVPHRVYTVTGTDANGCVNTDSVSVDVELNGCPGFPNTYQCDIDAIRQAFTAAGCLEMTGCVSECSMYFLNPQSMSGSQAQAFAQTLGTNLVSVQSAAENQCIISSLNSMGQTGVIWIGFNDEAAEGTFVWYDQAPVVYTNWAAGEPNNAGGNEDCTQIYADGTWNDLPCGSANAKSVIEVNLCPVVNAGLDVSVCIGDTAQLAVVSTLFGSSPYAYTWSNGPTGVNNPVSPNVTTDYSVTSVDRYDCTASDTLTVTVNNLPPVDAGPDVSVCPGAPVTVTGSGAATYVWNNGVTDGVAFTPSAVTTVLTVTGTDANGCENIDSLTVTVLLDQCVNNPANCDKDAIRQAFTGAGCVEMISCVSDCSMYFLNPQSMSGSQAQAFAQTLGANLVSIQDQAENDCLIGSLTTLGLNTINDVIWIGLNDEAVEGTFVWYDQAPVTYTNWSNIPNPQPDNWTGADPNGENCVQIYPDGGWNDLSCASANAKSVIEVNLCPVVNAGLDVSICVGDTAQLAATNALFGSSPYTYTWSNGPVGQNNPVSPAATSDFSIFVQDRYDCEAHDTVTVTVNPLPAVNAGPDVAVCPQVTVTLGGSGATSYTWTNGVVDGVAFVPPAGSTDYVVTGTDANSCENTDTVKVTVNPKPVVDAGNDQLICAGDMVTLTGNGAATYTWDNGVVNAVPFTPLATTTYTLVGTSGLGCNDTDQVTVTVTPIPVPAFAANTTLGCSPLFVTFTGVNVPGTTCLWNFGNGLTSVNCGTVNTVYIPEGCADVTLTLTTANGCVGQTVMNDMVCVVPDPVADFVSTPSQLNQTNSTATLVNMSSGATSYIWNFGDGSGPSNAVSPMHAFPATQAGTYQVMLIAVSNLGCTDTAFATVEVDESVLYYIPNSFTPNADMLNAEFKPVFASDFNITNYSFMIFNRWGEVIFKTQQPDSGWDGTRGNSDKLVEGGAYVWRLEFSHPNLEETKAVLGTVILLR